MLISMKDVLVLYEKLQEQTNIAHVSVIIFCALDIDALCTLKIISKILRSENIMYKVYLVSNYTQFNLAITDALTNDQVRLFLTINLGANCSLAHCQIIENTQTEIFVLDNHRPINPENILSPRIKVFNDDTSETKCPEPSIFQKYQEIAEYDLDSDPEDYDDTPEAREVRKNKHKLRRQKQALQQMIDSYQSHSFFGLPTSRLAYQLVRDLEKGSNDYLWYAIVAMTSMFLEQKLSKEELDRITQFYQTESNKHNSGQAKDKGEITKKKGFQFALMDHWSMYESMMHSNYLFAKMQLWQDRGVKRLNQFVHTIGISLQDAKQLYKYMSVEGQKMLDNSIFTAAEKFGLLEVAYLSFARNLDYSMPFMASDVVHILTCILEAAPPTTLSNAEMPEHQVKCFWEAYDQLEAGAQELGRHIEKCKGGLRALMAEARHVMERDHLITTNSMSIANIRGDSQNRLLFQHPFALIRLAYLLMTMLREHKRSRTLKPLIANWIGVESQLCLSVGVSIDHRNSLGNRFNAVAAKIGIDTLQDNFQANIIFFYKDHLSAFIKEISRT